MTNKPRQQIPEPVCGITSVAFSVSGRLLFAGYDDFECKVRTGVCQTLPSSRLIPIY